MKPPGDDFIPELAAAADRFDRWFRRIAIGLLLVTVAFFAAYAFAGPAKAAGRAGVLMGSCTPAPLRAFVHRHRLTVISAHRRGARIWPSGRYSLHSRCDGRAGAVDVRARRGVVAAARRAGFGVGVYCTHLHISTGGREGLFHRGCGRNPSRKAKRMARR